MKKNIFGTDGIRGLVGVSVNPTFFYNIGKSIALFASTNGEKKKIIVGTDTRNSRYTLALSLMSGICACGADVYFVDIISTPALSFLVKKCKFDYGVIITASHNPDEYNGIKIFNHNGLKIDLASELKLTEIYNYIQDFHIKNPRQLGVVHNAIELRKKYIDFLLTKFTFNLKNVNICLDCANGALSKMACETFKNLGANVELLGGNINKPINEKCGVMHIDNIVDKMKSGKYDIGFAFDGDGDRITIVTRDCKILDGDCILFFFSKLMKKQKLKENTVVGTVMTNYGTEYSLQKLGVNLLRTNVGDKNISNVIIQKGYDLGAEKSGHIILSKYLKTGDGLLCAIKFCEYVFHKNIDIDKVFEDYYTYPSVEANITIRESRRTQLLNDSRFKDLIFECEEKLFEEGRVLVRPSGTEEILRVLVEGKDENTITKILNSIKRFVADYK